MPQGIKVTVEVAKGKIAGRTESGSRVGFDEEAMTRVRELLAPIGSEARLMVNMVDHPVKDDKRAPRWLVQGAENVALFEADPTPEPVPVPEPAPTPGNTAATSGGAGTAWDETPVPEPTTKKDHWLTPVGPLMRSLHELVVELSVEDEQAVADYVGAMGLNPLIEAQMQAAFAAKDEAVAAIRAARETRFVNHLVALLEEHATDMAIVAREAGIRDIIPLPEPAVNAEEEIVEDDAAPDYEPEPPATETLADHEPTAEVDEAQAEEPAPDQEPVPDYEPAPPMMSTSLHLEREALEVLAPTGTG